MVKKSYYKKASKAKSFRKKKYTTGSSKNGELSKQLAVMFNPFSTATDTPKIPDGATSSSMGERLNFVFEIDRTSVGLAADVPMVAELSLGASIRTLMTLSTNFGITNPVVFALDNTGKIGANVPSEAAASWVSQLTYENMEKIRIVSLGYRFSLMNNADDNEGWFMAARIDTIAEGKAYKDPQLCNGFVAGKLRDIHKYQFTLHPNTRTFPYLPDFTTVDETSHTHDDGTGLDIGSKHNRHSGFDTIALKISGGKSTKLMCHISANVEFTIKEGSGLYRYQTTSLAYPQMIDSIIPKLRADPRAAVPVTGSFPLA